uniref:Uncharacterized protein n=1 Tax=Pseudomonas aeruginosa TaxID=287 RepID=A0A5E5R344_PSEAI|nr:hypothetical protein TUEID40_03428 [Pseudomonas aeruginosa]
MRPCTPPKAARCAGWAPTAWSARTRTPSASSAPTASAASIAPAASRAAARAAPAQCRKRSCRCMWSSNRHSSSRWSRTWSAAVSPATTRTSSDWPASSPATTARCSPWCSANTRKAPSTAPASTACCTSPAASTTATRPSSEYSPCATWRTSSPRATGCSRTVATAAANWAAPGRRARRAAGRSRLAGRGRPLHRPRRRRPRGHPARPAAPAAGRGGMRRAGQRDPP